MPVYQKVDISFDWFQQTTYFRMVDGGVDPTTRDFEFAHSDLSGIPLIDESIRIPVTYFGPDGLPLSLGDRYAHPGMSSWAIEYVRGGGIQFSNIANDAEGITADGSYNGVFGASIQVDETWQRREFQLGGHVYSERIETNATSSNGYYFTAEVIETRVSDTSPADLASLDRLSLPTGIWRISDHGRTTTSYPSPFDPVFMYDLLGSGLTTRTLRWRPRRRLRGTGSGICRSGLRSAASP